MSVPQLLTDARAYTATLTGQAQTAMSEAVNNVNAIGYAIPTFTAATLPAAPPSSVTLTPPTLDTVTLDLPAEPSNVLVFQDISAIETGAVPVLTAVAPTLTLPTSPSALAEFQYVPPVLNTSLVFPDPPAALSNPVGEAPVLSGHAEPIAPSLTVPQFDIAAPVNDTVAPTDLAQQFQDAYADATPGTVAMLDGYVTDLLERYNPRYAEQMGRIEDQLALYLDGGTGLNPAVEDAIYSRAQGKNDAESRRVRDQVLEDAAAMGHTLPTGTVVSAIAQARQGGADNNARAATEIVVMRAEMEQKNLQFAVTTSANLRTTLLSAALSYHSNLITINGQSLEYAKSVVGYIVELYNTALKSFTAKLDAWKAQAAVYETRLKGVLAEIELYKVEVDALLAMVQVDHARVEVYRARIEAQTALANVYRAQIDAVQGRVGLEKLKLEVFQANVQAFGATVQAKAAEWQGYTASVEGQTAVARVYSTRVEAFNSEVQAFKAGVEAKAEAVRATATSNQAKATQYQATLSGYTAVVNARGEKARTQLENSRQSVVAFQAYTGAVVAQAQVANEYYRTTSTVAIANADGKLKAQLGELDSRRSFGQVIAQLGNGNATVFGNLAGSAMAGMNTLSAETLAS